MVGLERIWHDARYILRFALSQIAPATWFDLEEELLQAMLETASKSDLHINGHGLAQYQELGYLY